MSFEYLVPFPQKLIAGKGEFAKPKAVRIVAPAAAKDVVADLKRDLPALADVRVVAKSAFAVRLKLAKGVARPEGYELSFDASGAEVVSSDLPGLYYGTQTLLQLLALGGTQILRPVRISDWPEFRTRSYMVDLGRSIFPVPFLERIVRILARLKMNTLHVHLNDDQLNGLRFNRLPLGRENPAALTLKQLGDLVRYARRHHVTILPEFECWGHAQASIYHFPELYGCPGMWGGMSFGIGEPTFEFFAKVFDELLPVLEKNCAVHVGLDEAHWKLLPSVPEKDWSKYTPTTLVARLHSILERVGRVHGRKVTMHLWADHGGRPLPKGIEKKVVIQPWNYEGRAESAIRKKMRKYAGQGKTPLMMGGGMSSVAFGGNFAATRLWCRMGKGKPNVEGITICHWEDNDLPERLIGLYIGADYAWSPATPKDRQNDPFDEKLRGQMGQQMRKWQAVFRDADDEALRRDRGPQVFQGRYCWGKRAGRAVAPTVEYAHADPGGAFE